MLSVTFLSKLKVPSFLRWSHFRTENRFLLFLKML
jgi:hypothetical protein